MELVLHKAAKEGDVDKEKLFLENGANVNTEDDQSNFPLHYAAGNGNNEIVKILLQIGADVNARKIF